MVNGVTIEQDVSSVLSDVVSRLRILESRYELFGERLLVVNRNMIQEYKKMSIDLQDLKEDIKKLKVENFKVKETIRQMFNELQYFAKKDEIKALEKYIKIWDPMKFCTEEDVKLIIKRTRDE
ncbi:MAG: hypothetical protein Q8R00_03725 [Candidatus Nanoarchaeia archaeon]|nr:hypothetical protein [Candidatus Nanoarchaeia archaeon]